MLLTSVALAIKGEVVMSEQLEEMFKALLSQGVPNTVNADIFAGLIFRVWQLKNIFAGC